MFQSGPNHPRWKNGRFQFKSRKKTYWLVLCPDHPRNQGRNDSLSRYVFEHILIVEKVLGKYLRKDAEIHHVNGDGLDNRKNNLVVCNDKGYHKILEQRTRALKDCGHTDWRECVFCKKYDSPSKLKIYGNQVVHADCHNKYRRERRKEKTNG